MRTRCIQFSIAGFAAMLMFLPSFAAIATNSLAASVVPTAQAKKRFIVTLSHDALPDDFCARRGFKSRTFSRHSPNGFAANLATNEALILPRLNMVICHLTGDEARTARGEKGVRFVEADGIAAPCGQTIPSGLVRIGADHFPVAHINGTPKSLNVDVAVLDTGIDPHVDLPTLYQSVCTYSNDNSDEVGHGTAVAGIIAAVDNSFGVVGVAPGVRLWNVKVLGPPPNDAWSLLLQGMEYVYENADQISVVNISLSNVKPVPYNATRIAVQNMVSAGVVVVAAAGNSTNDLAGTDGIYGIGTNGDYSDDYLPAALPEVMAVSAMDPTNDTIASFSNFSQIPRTNNFYPGESNYVFSTGGAIDVAAPGVNIPTTAPFNYGPDAYGYFTGTSGAAPHVTGLVALYIAANGRATNADGVYRIRQAIVNASLPQSQWHPNGQPFDAVANPTGDPDTNAEPLAVASEDWVPRSDFTSAAGPPGNFRVGFAAVPGYDYNLQSAANLTAPIAWSDLATIAGSNFVAPVSVMDTNALNQNFYRLQRNPSP